MACRHRLLPTQHDPAARLRLVCLPYAGGGAAAFYRWQPHVSRGIELVPIRLPGREDRFGESPYYDLRVLAQDAAIAIEEIDDRPFALLGHSMGAIAALEIALELRRRNMRGPELLIVSASAAPHRTELRPSICNLPDDLFLGEIVSRYDGIPEAVRTHKELLKQMLPILRADVYMLEQYAPADEPPLDCDILAIAGSEDRWMSITDLQAWGKYTSGKFSARLFPGGHFFLFRDQEESSGAVVPNPIGLQAVVDRLTKLIEEA